MGGARCSYQSCSQKSDKKTHMFHYPVFDKMRCHQWITNAQKLNYLSLKLSQLKNRMVCQHHFTDDCFMNEMKNKLKNYAVPTELGPYCIKSCVKEEDVAGNNREIELSINIDDIENEFISMTDRKAHLSLKYGDFLTNDVTEAITLPECKSTSIMLQDKGMIFNRYERKKSNSPIHETSHDNTMKKMTHPGKVNQVDNEKGVDTFEFENKFHIPMALELDKLNINLSGQNQFKLNGSVSSILQTPCQETQKQTHSVPVAKKVRIISEKHISEPVKIQANELQPVSPSVVIKLSDKKKSYNTEINKKEISTFYVDDSQNLQQTQNKLDNLKGTMVSFTHLPQDGVTDQMHLNKYTQPIIYEDQIGLNTLPIQNANAITDSKVDYIASQVNHSSLQLEPETGLYTNMGHNMTTVPNLELVSASLTGPSVYTLMEVSQMLNSTTNSSHMENACLAPQNALLPIDSEMLPKNHKRVHRNLTKTVNDTLGTSTVRTVVSDKQTSESNSPKKSMVRHKMPPQKVAAIQEKRKYNMKLRDILNSCLNNMDKDPDVEKLTAAMKKELNKKKVGEHLSNDSSLPQSQENVIAYFETRLQRMEGNLMNKIEENSLKITDLKKTVAKQAPTKKSATTQTYFTAQETKRTLYQQISQYLTPDLNSLIYEELFINQHKSKAEPKRRKRKSNNEKEL